MPSPVAISPPQKNNDPGYAADSHLVRMFHLLQMFFQAYASGVVYLSFVCTLTFVLSYNIGLGKINFKETVKFLFAADGPRLCRLGVLYQYLL